MMSILDSIDETVKELKVTTFDVSFNELADMYQEGELIITPNYQRTFRCKGSSFESPIIICGTCSFCEPV